VSKTLQVQVIPPPAPVSTSPLPIADGRATPLSFNMGGILVRLPVALVPLRGPGVVVPKGATVRVRAHNGQQAGNTFPVYVGLSRESVNNYTGSNGTTADILTPNTEVIYPVDNLAQIWINGGTGDGIVISIRMNS
jgi:hypothetical protein